MNEKRVIEKVDKKCFRCDGQLYKSELPDYTYQCFECDEDFYSFEQ